MKMKMKEGRRNGMREKPGCQDLQKHLKEGRRDCCNKGKQKSDLKDCEDGMKKKLRGQKGCVGQRRYQKEVWSGGCCRE